MYDPELRRFALTLHYYSPRAYNFVREKLDKCLPHAKTLSKWYRSVNGEPGINSESLQVIKRQVDNSSCQLVGALMFDEMGINYQKPEYVLGSIVGYVDFGKDFESERSESFLAKEALVFCVICINQKWKVPIAYFLTRGTSAETKANLVNQCLI